MAGLAVNAQAGIERATVSREVLQQDLPWLEQIGRPRNQHRLPAVLTIDEVQQTRALPDAGNPVFGLFERWLYGTGIRIMVGARLRVQEQIAGSKAL